MCAALHRLPNMLLARLILSMLWAAGPYLFLLRHPSNLSIAGPAFLAVNFLGGLGGLLSPFEAAAAGFGVLLVRQAVQGPLLGCCGAA